jgi:hypothetical protein
VDSFRDLGHDWDSYQGKMISLKCIDRAKALLFQLGDGWTPFPCSDGSVQLERHEDGLVIEILVSEHES